MTRRTVLAASGAAVAAGQGQTQAQQAQREKGPLVWMNMDQKELDDAYDQSVYAPNQPQLGKRRSANSEIVRKRLGEPRRFAYGPTPIESMEVWTTARPNAPVMVFVHGGAWRVGLAKEHCYAAELYVNAGAHYAVLDFINVDQAGGDLMPMAEQIRRAIAWIGKNAASFGGDAGRIHVSGHSSGAHLAGVTLITDWAAYGAPADILKGAVLCSGMYDLKPARLSKRGAYVKFTDAMEDALSTQRHLARINCPVAVAYGTYETPEFQRQSRDFAAALKAAGKPVTLLVGEGYNHFEMPETFASPYGLLGRAVLEQMKLA
ncbi:MAG: alpha/beta hydrolase [Xanthobacteraceae bacterium]|nr:alpha/beta hydrolase [Xanthobacteraceae bacterium]